MDYQDTAANPKSGFYRLPTEVLVMIVEALEIEDGEKQDCHFYRRFANLDYINKILFTSIQLEPTRASLTSLQRGDFSRVAEFASSITFVAPPSWALLFETFKHIGHTYKEPFDPYFPRDFGKSMLEQSVIEYLEGHESFSEEQVAEGYAAYIRQTKVTQSLLEDEDSELKTAWVAILRKLGNRLRKVQFVSRPCADMRQMGYFDTSSQKDLLPCRLNSHYHSGDTDEYACKHANAIAGDRLFITVMSCLAASGVAIRHLAISHCITGNFECANIPGWQDLNLSGLEELKFSPDISSNAMMIVEDSVLDALPCLDLEEIEQKTSDVLHALVDKSQTSLKYLKLTARGPITWPSHPATFDLPVLERLEPSIYRVNEALLRDWIVRMAALRYIKFSYPELEQSDCWTDGWRHVFDAIRDHPNASGPNPKGLEVVFEHIALRWADNLSWSGVVCSDPEIAEERPERHSGLEESEDYDFALGRHLYGEIPYEENHVLRYWLRDEDPNGPRIVLARDE
ncbi:hypothetical protein FSARC_6538 [Fusarium sarcochroum]|uniref:Uncharacterized protein n=1 Tax=Fusarium sarcochroum TaxID=1208366 RepID=A0A8H4TWZ4_9HYPO|nr:hypothetical protein FSARC_6538 [Fusarium sarcochroum]